MAGWFEPGIVITVITLVVGGIMWLIRLEGRVTTNERVSTVQAEAFEKQLAERDKSLDLRHSENKDALKVINDKLDRLLERH